MDYFEKASRLNIMFDTSAGTLGVNDLWRLPLSSQTGRANLDDIARALNAKVSAAQESFVSETKAPAEGDVVAFAVVKRVIEVRLAEAKDAREAKEKADRKQQLLALLAEKQTEELRSKSADEIRAMIEKL